MNKIPSEEKCKELIDALWDNEVSYMEAVDIVQYWFNEVSKEMEEEDAGTR